MANALLTELAVNGDFPATTRHRYHLDEGLLARTARALADELRRARGFV